MADMRGRFIYVKDPYEKVPFWYAVRYWIACLFLPELKWLRRNHLEHYTTHQYMLSVHVHYEAQLRQLNKAITRLSKKNKSLQKDKLNVERINNTL